MVCGPSARAACRECRRRLRTAYDSSQVVLREVRRAWCGEPLEERVYAVHELLLLGW